MAKTGAVRKKESKMLTVSDVMERLKLSERTVRRYIANGNLRVERIGPRDTRTGKPRHVRIAEVDLEVFIRTGGVFAAAH